MSGRLLTHEHATFASGWAEIRDRWCIDEVLSAHRYLDALDDALTRMRARSNADG
jgi:hypothetical protein